MATIGNYGAALGDTLKQTAGGIVKGFGYGLKGAMMAEAPALVAGYGAFSSLSKKANSMGQAKQAMAQGTVAPQTKTPVAGNPFTQMVQQLAQINANTALAANVAKASAQAEQYKMMFEEEKAREQAQQNQALIDAIKNSGFGGGGKGNLVNGPDGGGGGFGISDFLKNNAKELGVGALAVLLRRQIAGMVSRVMLRALASPLTGAIVSGGIAAASMGGTIVTMLRGLMFTALRGLLFTPAGLVAAGIGGLMYYSRKTENKQTKDAVQNNLPVAPMPNKTFEQEAKELREQAKNEKDPLKRTELETKAKAAQNNVAQEKIKNSPLTLENRQKAWKEKYAKSHNVTGAPKVVTTGNYLDNLARAESATKDMPAGDPNAKNPMPGQTASGLFQFTKATWTGTVEKMAAKGLINKEDYADLKYRFDPAKSRKVAEFFTEQNRLGLEKALNRPITQTDLYMAHFLGLGGNENGAIRFLKAYAKDPNGLAINYAGSDQVAANPSIFYTKDAPPRPRTLQEVYALMSKKIGGGNKPSVGPQTSENDKKPSTGDVPVVSNVSQDKKVHAHGFRDQRNRNRQNAVKAYYDALKRGKTEEEAKAIAIKVAGNDDVAINAVNAVAKNSVAPVVTDAVVAKTSTTPLIEMGDAGVAESMANKSPAWVDAYIRKVAAKGYYTERETAKRTQEVLKELGGIKENTRITAKEAKINRIRMAGGKLKSPAQILAETNKQFTDSLQRQLTRTISGSLMKALYPGGYKNVSQRTASGQLYRGEQLNKMLGLTPQLTKLGTSIFGKQYGPAFGQIFSKAATGYMEVGARSVAQGIFGLLPGGPESAQILGGQILGNLAKGTQQGKVTALEQIIYGVSGGQVALGPETIFAKYGFASPQDGISYMANVLGAAAMGPIDSALGTTPANMGNMDPRMRTMGSFGGFNGQYNGMPTGMTGPGMPSAGTLQAAAQNNPYLQLNKDGMVVIKDNMPQQTKDIAETLNATKKANADAWKQFDEAGSDADARAIAQKMVSETQLQEQMLTNRLLASRATGGSGTTIGSGGTGGGGFFSGGGPLAEVGNMALDLGKSAITQKVVQSMGIKNPYMALLASFAVNKGVSYLGGKAYDMFAGTEMGKTVTGAFSNFGDTLTSGYNSIAPSWAQVGGNWTQSSTGLNVMAGEGGSTISATGLAEPAGATPLASGFESFAPYLPYIPAFVALAKGDVGAAAGYAIGAYAGTALGAELASLGAAAGPVGAVAGFVIGTLLAGFFGGGGGRQPNPTIWRIIRVKDNNNINLIVDLQPPQENPPKEFFNLCDSLLRVGFNATKAAEVTTQKPPPFDFIMCTMNGPDGVFLSLRKGDPASADFKAIALGKADKSFSAGKAATEIVKLITDTFKEAYAADTTALDNASKLLNKKTYTELSAGLAKEFKTGTNKIDVTKEQGVFGATAAQDAIISAGMANKRKEVSSYTTGGDGGGDTTTTPPMIWSMKEGKYVEAPFKEETVTVVGEDGAYQVKQKVYDTTALMYDANGKLITDKNNSGGIDLADIVTPTLTTTSGTITGGTTTAATSATGAGATGTVNVVTNADNSQRNSQSVNTYYTSLLSKSRNAIRDASVNAGLPA